MGGGREGLRLNAKGRMVFTCGRSVFIMDFWPAEKKINSARARCEMVYHFDTLTCKSLNRCDNTDEAVAGSEWLHEQKVKQQFWASLSPEHHYPDEARLMH